MVNIGHHGAVPESRSAAEQNALRIDQSAMLAQSSGEWLLIPEGDFYTNRRTVIPNEVSVEMRGGLVYTDDSAGLQIGNASSAPKKNVYRNLSVRRHKTRWIPGQSGIELSNCSGCDVTVRLIEGFDEGLLCNAGRFGFLYNSIRPGMIGGCRVGIHVTSSHESPNQNTFDHGSIKLWSSQVAHQSTGILFDAAPGGYTNHNGNVFRGISIELGKENAASIPVDLQCGQLNDFSGLRHESATAVCVREVKAVYNRFQFGWWQQGVHLRPANNGSVVTHLGRAVIPTQDL